jgi:hypothetical protein
VLDATNDYKLHGRGRSRPGRPARRCEAGRARRRRKDGKAGWQFTLHFPSYFPILQFADKRALRETIYRATPTKASEMGSVFSELEKWDNTANIATLLKLRDEEAKLLDYRNFAEVSLVPKMAQSPEHVIEFLEDLARRARPFAEKDLAELRAFARDELGIDQLEAWDLAYASEKLRERRYAFSAQEVKEYFPETKVVDGLFKLVQKPVLGADQSRQRAGLASGRALLPHRTRRQAGRPVLPRPVRPQRQGRRRLDGRRPRPPPGNRRRGADAGRLPDLQFHPAGHRRRPAAALAVHA